MAIILHMTLFPFDFVIDGPASLTNFLSRIDTSLLSEPLDFVLNTLLFVPLGFFITELRRRQSFQPPRLIVICLLMGFAFSFCIEFGQFWILLRHAALADVLANTAGAGVGACLNLSCGDTLTHAWRSLLVWERRSVKASHYLLALAAYTVASLLLYGAMLSESRVRGWDPDYPLLVGNERTGDRPWSGTVSRLLVADRALSDAAAAAYLAGDTTLEPPAGTQLSLYSLTGTVGTADQGGHLPELVWRGAGAAGDHGVDGVALGAGRWLETGTSVTTLTERIMAHSEFTLGIVARPAMAAQSGPARIVSISTNPLLCNVTLGQDGNDLSLRLRMPFSDDNGRKPEFIVPDLFAEGQPRHLLVTYDGEAIRIHVDTVGQLYEFSTTPAALLPWRFSPTDSTRVRLGAFSPWLFEALSAVAWGVPLGLLLWGAWRKTRTPPASRV